MADIREEINFYRNLAVASNNSSGATLASGATMQINLDQYRNSFGYNYNTLNIRNEDANNEIIIILDGVEFKNVDNGGGVFGFDWEDGINFSFLEIKNNGAAVNTTTNIKLSIGRTGKKVR